MKYTMSTMAVLFFLMLFSPSTGGVDTAPIKDGKQSQPEIFSNKPKPEKCIDKIQVQQRTMVQELKKIRNLLKKKKKE